MARYLVVAHKTLDSEELRTALWDLLECDDGAVFDLLVPATPARPLVSEAGEDVVAAHERAQWAAASLRELGFRIGTARSGAPDAVDAIRDRLAADPGYECIVISTLPPGLSRWLHVDAVSRARRIFGGRLVHVAAHRSLAPALVGR